MMDFFKGQYDYIYFFYGLSFLFLALICFNIDQRKSRTLPWFLVGLFGLVHGINEWIDLLVVIYGQNNTFSLLHPIILGLSYILLFEFSLLGYVRLEKKIIARRWVYAPLLCMVFLGAKSGDNGLSAAIRYFLGFPAAILSAFVVFRAARTEHKEKWPLYTLSITLALYATFTGLIVPKANFLVAQWLNFDSFYQTFKFPAQLVRGVLALCSAMAVWFYSSVLSDITYRHQRYRRGLRLTKWAIIFTIVVLIGLGWVFTNFFDYYASIQIIKNTKERANSPLNYLIKELTALEKIAVSLSRSSVIRNAVLLRKETERVTPLFENFRKRFDIRSCSLIDTKGAVISSVGETVPEKALDKSFIRRAYFKDALSGNTGFSFSLGSKYNERVYYVSYPVKNTKGMVDGIVLVTKIIPVKPVLQYRFFSILITFFVCVLTITFFIVLRKRESLIEFIDHANTQLQEVDKLKTDFISIVSHELRTPLTAINNAATILMKGKLNRVEIDPREKELIEIIIKNTDRQTRMVGDLLDVSKIEAGVMPMYIEQLDVVALISDAVRTLQPQASGKSIVLDISSNVKASMISIDPEHTRRIVTNLLTNAIKYTPEGGRVKVHIHDEFWEVVISVSDTGPGIPKDQIGKLFNKFYRASDAAARQLGGTGLGLMITKGLVEAQGGRIWLESEVGKGSTFYFALSKTDKKIKQEAVA
jgi:signal transduction histidine kinase